MKNKKLPQEYYEFVKDSVRDGSYFKDSLNWYFLRYVNPLCDRTMMGFAGIVAIISLYFLFQIISNTFPLVQEVPIVIRDHDSSVYRPIIMELKKQQTEGESLTVDELTAKYLLSSYIKDRESYDFRDSDVGSVNTKFNRVKNNSSYAEYKNFQLFMSRENAASPINNFGRNVFRTVEISSVKFIKMQQKNQSSFQSLFKQKIPEMAEIRFTTITRTFDEDGVEKQNRENFLAKIKFKFDGLNREAKSGVLNFVVNDYNLFKIK